jgi:hypothetical protein
MPNQSQYGETLLLRDIHDATSAKALTRIHFSAQPGGSLYDEAWLQNLIMFHPGLVPVGQIEPAFLEMVPICTELPMRAGFVDNVFVTPSGDIALVECKLWRNPEARRKVIAQIIDYASELQTWDYEALESAIQRARAFGMAEGSSFGKLYEAVSAGQDIDEVGFHDAVSRNLKRGRFLLLIVGDGIREGVETMAEFLQQNAGLHFTLSIVELALFEVPTIGYIAQPRVLARTTNIDRGVVTLTDSRMQVVLTSVDSRDVAPRATSITQEHFFETLDQISPGVSGKVERFLQELAPYNVQADYNVKTLTLRWHAEGGGSWNLGTIVTSGEVWFDYHATQARNLNRLDASKEYLNGIAAFVPGAALKETKSRTAWNVADRNGHALRIEALLADETRRAAWVCAVAIFQQKVSESPEE